MDILDDMEVSKLSANVFLKVNNSFKCYIINFIDFFFVVSSGKPKELAGNPESACVRESELFNVSQGFQGIT